jgi:hypothetical protein
LKNFSLKPLLFLSPAIQSPHAGRPTPTATNGCYKARVYPKGDLSAFDIDSDTSPTTVPHPLAETDLHNTSTAPRTQCSDKKAVKNASPANQHETIEGCPTSDRDCASPSDGEVENPFCEKLTRSFEEVGREESVGTNPVDQCPPDIAAAPQSQPRQPLQSLNSCTAKPLTYPPAKSRGKSPFRSLATANLCEETGVPSYHKLPSVCEMCTVPQNEATCFPTNTVPFSSSEAQLGAGFACEGCLKTRHPIMAGVAVGPPSKRAPLENKLLCHLPNPDMGPLLSPDTKKVRELARFPGRKTPDITAVLRVSGRPSQSSGTPGESPQFASLCTGSVIDSMPSPSPAPPSPAAFLQAGAALALRPSADGSSDCGVFQSEAAIQFPGSVSSAAQKCDFPDVAHFSPALGTTTHPSTVGQSGVDSTASCRGGEEVPQTDGVRRMVKRCRSRRKRRRRREIFLSSCMTTSLSSTTCTAGEKEAMDTVGSAALCPSIRHMEPDNSSTVTTTDLEEENGTFSIEKEVSYLVESGMEESRDPANSGEVSVPTNSPATTATHQEQLVPGDEPPCTSPHPHLTPSPAPAPAGKEDLMCDMFQLLTPDRPTPAAPGSRRHSGDFSSGRQTSKRRVFRSAPTEGSSNFYSLFINDSDIFM